MSETPNTLTLTSSRTEQIFPILTSAQILRIAEHGNTRVTQRGEVLVEPRYGRVATEPHKICPCGRRGAIARGSA
jgi:hypothetical protein